MAIYNKRAAPVILIFAALTLALIGRRVGLLTVSGHAGRTMIEFVTIDAVHRLGVLAVASAVVWLVSYGVYRLHPENSNAGVTSVHNQP